MSAGVTARRFSYSVLMRLGSLYRAALSASELAIDNTLPRGLTVERRIATRARSSSLAVTGSARTLAISSEIRPSTSSAVLPGRTDRKSTRLNSSHLVISYAVLCLQQKNTRLNPVTLSSRMPSSDLQKQQQPRL